MVAANLGPTSSNEEVALRGTEMSAYTIVGQITAVGSLPYQLTQAQRDTLAANGYPMPSGIYDVIYPGYTFLFGTFKGNNYVPRDSTNEFVAVSTYAIAIVFKL
jgi:hypothetical protein